MDIDLVKLYLVDKHKIAAQDLVKQWENEWLCDGERGHWGDYIDWSSARQIARRIDEERPATSLAAQDGLLKLVAAFVNKHQGHTTGGIDELDALRWVVFEAGLFDDQVSAIKGDKS